MLDSASKPSDAIKTETLLAGLGPEYKVTLVGLDSSSTTGFKEIVSRLRKAQTKLKNQGIINTHGLNEARKTFIKNDSKKKKGACFYYGTLGYFKKEYRKLLAELESRSDSDT